MMMKKILLLLAGTLTLMYFTSCDDEQEKDEIPPEVFILSPTGAEALSNAVNIQAEVNDNIAVKQWKIYIDDELLEEGTNETISVEWDSKTVINGDHVIKITAIDAAENEGVSTIDVEVLNDTGAPQVEISTITDKPFVKGTVNIQATATDDLSVNNLQLFIDEELVETFESSTLDYEWNTTTVADGPHVIKVVATDGGGNAAMANTNVEVFNYFISLDLIDPSVPETMKLWYFVSRQDGSLIQAKPYVPGENKIVFETPDDYEDGQIFTFSQFIRRARDGGFSPSNSLSINPEYKAGTYEIPLNFTGYVAPPPAEVIGKHTIRIEGNGIADKVVLQGEGIVSRLVNEGIDFIEVEVDLYAADNKGHILIRETIDSTPKFTLLNNLAVGGTTVVEWSSMEEVKGVKFPAAPNTSFSVSVSVGYEEVNNYFKSRSIWEKYPDWNTMNFDHEFYHLGEVFQEYLFNCFEQYENGGSRSYVKLGTTHPTEFPSLPFEITEYNLSNGEINISFDNVYDNFSIWGSTDSEDLDNTYWLRIPKQGSLKIPEIPQELTTEFGFPQSESFVFTDWSVSEFDGLDGYQEYIDALYEKGPVQFLEVSKESWSISGSLPGTQGGRIKKDELEDVRNKFANSLFGHQPLFPKMQLRK